MQIPRAEKGKVCPFNQKDMSTVCHKCPLWTKLMGKDPQTGEPRDEWGCAFTWLPILLIENSRESRQTGAAVESFRNEMVKNTDATNNILLAATQRVEVKRLEALDAAS